MRYMTNFLEGHLEGTGSRAFALLVLLACLLEGNLRVTLEYTVAIRIKMLC